MPYWQLYYHLVWATKRREPLIQVDLEPELYSYLRGKALSLGAIVHAIGGVADHVYVVAPIPPRIAVAAFVGQLKEASSHWVNHISGYPLRLDWQEGYGAFSLTRRALPFLGRYVLEQCRTHATGRVIPVLECTEASPPDGSPSGYQMRAPFGDYPPQARRALRLVARTFTFGRGRPGAHDPPDDSPAGYGAPAQGPAKCSSTGRPPPEHRAG